MTVFITSISSLVRSKCSHTRWKQYNS